MPLTQDQIALVRESFRTLGAEKVPVAEAFYARLFEVTPEVRPLFRGDMATQGAKLMKTLGTVVAQLHDLAPLQPVVEDLARRHVRYGVEPAHYGLVGEALIWTMANALGDRFDAATRTAWGAAYTGVAEAMITAAYPPAGAATA